MYYVEEIIDGVLCYKLSPEDEWHPVDIKTATKKIIKLQEQVKKLTTKCSLVEVDREMLQVCIDMYKSGEKITAIKWLIEEAKKVEYKFGIKWAHEYFQSIGLEAVE